MNALFEKYPQLEKTLPYLLLGHFPTPLQRCSLLEKQLECGGLWIKRDDLSGLPYGGNKLRKLEFLLADALRQGAGQVLTFGCAGSNHALATSIYAHQLGLQPVSVLLPQPNTDSVTRNLRMGAFVGARLHYCQGTAAVSKAVRYHDYISQLRFARPQRVIPPGGSEPLGVMGFVNAAFELARQVEEGLMARPDVIYLPLGTAGTYLGLKIGLQLALPGVRLQAVRVVPDTFMPLARVQLLYRESLKLLEEVRPAGKFEPEESIVAEVREEFLGQGYAFYSQQSVHAVRLARMHAGLKLEGTYSGKALAALIADSRSGNLRGKNVLFWNTLNSHPFPPEAELIDEHRFSPGLRRYFHIPAQWA